MARTRVLPTSIIVRRNDPKRDRFQTPQFSERLPVIIQPETSPTPIPDTSFFGVGRDPTHAWPHRWLYQAVRIQEILSVRSSESSGNPLVAKIPSAKVVNMPQGRQLPTNERTNIIAPANTSYGSLAALSPSASWSPAYGKITP